LHDLINSTWCSVCKAHGVSRRIAASHNAQLDFRNNLRHLDAPLPSGSVLATILSALNMKTAIISARYVDHTALELFFGHLFGEGNASVKASGPKIYLHRPNNR